MWHIYIQCEVSVWVVEVLEGDGECDCEVRENERKEIPVFLKEPRLVAVTAPVAVRNRGRHVPRWTLLP
jgi:hypothetical protein